MELVESQIHYIADIVHPSLVHASASCLHVSFRSITLVVCIACSNSMLSPCRKAWMKIVFPLQTVCSKERGPQFPPRSHGMLVHNSRWSIMNGSMYSCCFFFIDANQRAQTFCPCALSKAQEALLLTAISTSGVSIPYILQLSNATAN